MATVTLSNLTIRYREVEGQRPWPSTIDQLSATFPSEQVTLLIGPSGSGKSTLLKTIAGLYPQFGDVTVSGEVRIDSENKEPRVAMMFQDPNQQFAMDTVVRELRFALENLQVPVTEMDQRVTEALDYVGISALRHRQLNSLSGGEKQKVALAIIVAMNSDVILLDEPFASIDPEARTFLLTKLRQLNQEAHKTIIIADHDLLDYEDYVDQLVRLGDGGKMLNFYDDTEAHAVFTQFEKDAQLNVPVNLPTETDTPAVTLTDFGLSAGKRQLLNQSQFAFYQSRITLLTGINGSGKSTLLRAMTKLSNYTGNLSVAGVLNARSRRHHLYEHIGLVFQEAEQQFLNVTVQEELDLSLKNSAHPEYFKNRLAADLDLLDLTDLTEHVVYSLSGGQKKKLQILIMMMMATPILLMDEPFTGLDFQSLTRVVQLIKSVQEAFQLTLIIVSHQLQGLAPLIDYHVVLQGSRLQYVEVIK